MNTASQNFPHHLAKLRERMLHPTDYEKSVYYFLEEFAAPSGILVANMETRRSSISRTSMLAC